MPTNSGKSGAPLLACLLIAVALFTILDVLGLGSAYAQVQSERPADAVSSSGSTASSRTGSRIGQWFRRHSDRQTVPTAQRSQKPIRFGDLQGERVRIDPGSGPDTGTNPATTPGRIWRRRGRSGVAAVARGGRGSFGTCRPAAVGGDR